MLVLVRRQLFVRRVRVGCGFPRLAGWFGRKPGDRHRARQVAGEGSRSGPGGKKGKSPTSRCSILLHPGIYMIRKTVEFTTEDSGSGICALDDQGVERPQEPEGLAETRRRSRRIRLEEVRLQQQDALVRRRTGLRSRLEAARTSMASFGRSISTVGGRFGLVIRTTIQRFRIPAVGHTSTANARQCTRILKANGPIRLSCEPRTNATGRVRPTARCVSSRATTGGTASKRSSNSILRHVPSRW